MVAILSRGDELSLGTVDAWGLLYLTDGCYSTADCTACVKEHGQFPDKYRSGDHYIKDISNIMIQSLV